MSKYVLVAARLLTDKKYRGISIKLKFQTIENECSLSNFNKQAIDSLLSGSDGQSK
jgi:hypothetical protein